MPKANLSVFMGEDVYKKWAEMYMTSEQWEELKGLGIPLNDVIVECAMDEQKRWRYMRLRKDKKHGNHISTVNSVMESVRDAVSKEDLIKEEAAIKKEWKMRARAVEAAVEAAAEARVVEAAAGAGAPAGAPAEVEQVAKKVKR